MAISRAQNVDPPVVIEFFDHPNFRQISIFFLGWVFWSSMHYVLHSQLLHSFLKGAVRLFRPKQPVNDRRSTSADAGHSFTRYGEKDDGVLTLRKQEHEGLKFLLSFCFAVSGLSQFFSLLSQEEDQSTCALVVAFGDIFSEGGRVVGLLVLNLELRRKVDRQWESYAFWMGLFVASVLTLANVLTSTGVTSGVSQFGIFLCTTRHTLATSILTTLVDVALELYASIRIFALLKPPRFRWKTASDVWILRALSLLSLDLLVVVPNAVATNVLAAFVPFSLGSLCVLAAFNQPEMSTLSTRRPSLSFQPVIPPGRPSPTPSVRSLNAFAPVLNIGPPLISDSRINAPLPNLPVSRGPSRRHRYRDSQRSAAPNSVSEARIESVVRQDVSRSAVAVPVQFPSRSSSNSSTRSIVNLNLDRSSSGPQTRPMPGKRQVSEKILPTQAQVGNALERLPTHPRGPRALTARPRPKITVQIATPLPSPYSPPQPEGTSRSSAYPRSNSGRSPGSIQTIFGSDIIRASLQGPGRRDRDRHPHGQGQGPGGGGGRDGGSSPPKSSSTTTVTHAHHLHSGRPPSSGQSTRTSFASPRRSTRRYSWATMGRRESLNAPSLPLPPLPGMPIVLEGEGAAVPNPAVVTPTFGQFFAQVRRPEDVGVGDGKVSGRESMRSRSNTEPSVYSASPSMALSYLESSRP